MAVFDLRLDFDGRPIAKAKAKNINEFDNLIEALKLKFNGRGKK